MTAAIERVADLPVARPPVTRREGQRQAAVLLVALFGLASACAAPLATEEQKRMAERRLLAPFLQPRTVACSELVVDASANFNANVGNPGVDKTHHRFERTESDGVVEKVWTNITGARAGWFTVTIGERGDAAEIAVEAQPQTTFKVFNEFRLRVHERGAMTLAANAGGPVVVVEEAGAEARPVPEFQIADGVLLRR